MKRLAKFSAYALATGLMASSALSAELRIGLQDDADVLDPAQSRTFVGRIVYTSLCDKLVDLDNNLSVIPQLATAWAWGDNGGTLTMDLRKGLFSTTAHPSTLKRQSTTLIVT